MHKSSHDKMNWFKNNFLDKRNYLNILDIGSLDTSGNNYNYKSIFNEPNWSYDGLDFRKGKNVDIITADIYNIQEIADESYDVVICGQLFEHLGFFWLTMGEISRILKPGGFCCIIAPSGGPKHGIEDADCYRFYEDGMRGLANYVNFDIKLLRSILPVYLVISCAEATSNDACLDGIKYGPRESGNTMAEEVFNTRSKNFSELVKRRFVLGSYCLAKKNQDKLFIRAQKIRRMIVDRLNEILGDNDVVLLPASGKIAPLIDKSKEEKVEVLDDSYAILENHLALGNCAG